MADIKGSLGMSQSRSNLRAGPASLALRNRSIPRQSAKVRRGLQVKVEVFKSLCAFQYLNSNLYNLRKLTIFSILLSCCK